MPEKLNDGVKVYMLFKITCCDVVPYIYGNATCGVEKLAKRLYEKLGLKHQRSSEFKDKSSVLTQRLIQSSKLVSGNIYSTIVEDSVHMLEVAYNMDSRGKKARV